MGLSSFACPRCESDVEEDYYGPCGSCRAELRASLGGDPQAVVAVEYEPKMNVTPNAVALKDD
jgi:hypothetical protein